jgi:hypothetical protein
MRAPGTGIVDIGWRGEPDTPPGRGVPMRAVGTVGGLSRG